MTEVNRIQNNTHLRQSDDENSIPCQYPIIIYIHGIVALVFYRTDNI